VSVAAPRISFSHGARAKRAVVDANVLGHRYLLHYVRQPDLLFFSTVQPIMFVLLFNYVFGGAIGESLLPGVDYIDFLIPGILIQTVAFASSTPAVSMAKDKQEGIADRFHLGAQLFVWRAGEVLLDAGLGLAGPNAPMTTGSMALWRSVS